MQGEPLQVPGSLWISRFLDCKNNLKKLLAASTPIQIVHFKQNTPAFLQRSVFFIKGIKHFYSLSQAKVLLKLRKILNFKCCVLTSEKLTKDIAPTRLCLTKYR